MNSLEIDNDTIANPAIEAASEAIHDFLDERFPEGAMPGGKQLFAEDDLDAEFKHEAGCDELAIAVLEAAIPLHNFDQAEALITELRAYATGNGKTEYGRGWNCAMEEAEAIVRRLLPDTREKTP